MHKLLWIIFIDLLSCIPFVVYAQVDHWEALVRSDQVWKYNTGDMDPGSTWTQLDFNDSSWNTGIGGVGFGDGDDSTLVDPVISVFLRKKFNIIDLTKISKLVLNIDYDDGFVAYLNDIEFARANLGSPGTVPSYNDTSNYSREARIYRGLSSEEFRIPFDFFNSILTNGENILAIQVHNQSLTSNDLSAIVNLLAGINDPSLNYQEIPAWLPVPLNYTISELPIVSINTLGQQIQDDLRIKVEMGVIDNGPGNTNQLSDPYTNYHGWINIEFRGESASEFPKKSYGFETQDSAGNNNNYPLLGLPEENDWILNGPYSDKSLVRNVIAYHLSNQIGRYASRTKYCDLFINNEYMGLYILMEKIKRDKNRVDISKLNPDDVSGDQLTGGYILRIDKLDENDYPPWESYPSPAIPGERPVNLQYFDPDGFELTDGQKSYIQNYILNFESALNSNTLGEDDPAESYRSYAEVNSFIDHIILTEITKNVDGYFYSTYVYKDRDSKGGKLIMGPAWDFNISQGNVDYAPQILDSAGWVYEDFYRVYWFRQLMTDNDFVNELSCRYHSLRRDILSDEKISYFLDSLESALETSAERNFRRWPIMGDYVWPNAYVGNSYSDEMNYLRNWLKARLRWMDENISENCVVGIDNMLVEIITAYPNPSSDRFVLNLGNNARAISNISVLDYYGKSLANITIQNKHTIDLSFSEFGIFKSGLYLCYIQFSDGKHQVLKIIKE